MDFLGSKPHGQQSEEPGNQGSSCRSCKAVSSPHSDVVSAGQSGGQSHHAGDECQWQERSGDAITCDITSFNQLRQKLHHVNATPEQLPIEPRSLNYINVAIKIQLSYSH